MKENFASNLEFCNCMLASTLPSNEKERLKELRGLNILNTLPDKSFDDIARLASYICNVPIALISLVGEDRQYFKSRVGLSVEGTEREFSFCAHAITQPREVFEVPDATQDLRFRDNPLVTGDPKIVFYTGVPLVSANGHALGTLCVIDHKPNKLSEAQTEALTSLAGQVLKLLELHKINQDLEKSNSLIQNYADQMEQFAYMASHDLKEPLRTVRIFTEKMQRSHAAQLDEKGQQYLYYIADGTKRMTRLIEDLLNYAKAGQQQQGKLTPFPEVMQDFIQLHREFIEEKQAHISWDSRDSILIPYNICSVILRNLILNAIKYVPVERHPVVLVEVQESGSQWNFTVTDNGVGIAAADLDKIFLPFHRIHNGKEKGYGFGLAACKRMIEKQGGTITVHSSPGNGSIFQVSLPKN
jgi:signal transduction histidine kinase